MRHLPSFRSPLGTILFVQTTWTRCSNLLLYAKFVTVSCILWKSLVQNKVLGAKWSVSHASSQFIPISPKSDKVHNVNRVSVIGF